MLDPKRLLVTLVATLAGCSSAGEAAPIAPAAPAPPPAGEVAPAAAPKQITLTFPQVFSRGGPVIQKPRVLPIFFAGDDNVAHIKAFNEALTRDPYWMTAAREYGVGAIEPLNPIVITPAPTGDLDATELESWLVTKLGDGTLGTPDPSTLYAVFTPKSVNVVDPGGGTSCREYAGYHYELEVGTTKVGYALIPDCESLTELTVTTSHEYFEWATDPFPSSEPAYNKLSDEHWAWEATMLGELSDLCDFLDRDYLTLPGGYRAQRHWSNALSREGGFPCAPKKRAPYFQAVAIAEDDAVVPDYTTNDSIHTKAIRVPKGGTKTVEVFVYSDQAVEQVSVRAASFGELMGSPDTMGYRYALSGTSARSGERVQLTVTAPTHDAFDLAAISATVGETRHFWPVLVVNDDAAAPAKGVQSVRRSQLPRRRGQAEASHAGHGMRKFLPIRK